MTPKRIQMTRLKPWRENHPDAIVVDRRTKWGNPFKVESSVADSERFMVTYGGVCTAPYSTYEVAAKIAVEHFLQDLYGHWLRVTPADVRRELAGKDLACWCNLNSPCHADALLEIANSQQTEQPE